MSQRERDVLNVMALVLSGDRSQVEAARLLGRSDRPVNRLLRLALPNEIHGTGGGIVRHMGPLNNLAAVTICHAEVHPSIYFVRKLQRVLTFFSETLRSA